MDRPGAVYLAGPNNRDYRKKARLQPEHIAPPDGIRECIWLSKTEPMPPGYCRPHKRFKTQRERDREREHEQERERERREVVREVSPPPAPPPPLLGRPASPPPFNRPASPASPKLAIDSNATPNQLTYLYLSLYQ